MHFSVELVTVIGISAALSAALVFPVERLFRVFSIIDHPSTRGVHRHSVARAGGLVLLLSLFAALKTLGIAGLAHFAPSPEQYRLLYLMSLVVVCGLVDDRFDLKWSVKLSLQILLAAILVANSSSLGIITTSFADHLRHFIFYLVAVNAINLIDGLNGLCISISVLSLLVLLLLADDATLSGSHVLALLPIVIGSLIGIAKFNLKGPRIFLGESGAMLLGFLVVVFFNTTVQARGYSSLNALILYLCILGHPLIELVGSCVRRFISSRILGKPIIQCLLSIVVADANHLHHRLLRGNNSQLKTLGILCLLHSMCLAAIFALYP